VMRPGQRRADDDRIRAFVIEYPVRDVRLLVVDDLPARFELEIAKRCNTMFGVDVFRCEWRMHEVVSEASRRRCGVQSNVMTVRMPSPRASAAKPSLMSRSAIRAVTSSSSLIAPFMYASTIQGKSRSGRALP